MVLFSSMCELVERASEAVQCTFTKRNPLQTRKWPQPIITRISEAEEGGGREEYFIIEKWRESLLTELYLLLGRVLVMCIRESGMAIWGAHRGAQLRACVALEGGLRTLAPFAAERGRLRLFAGGLGGSSLGPDAPGGNFMT